MKGNRYLMSDNRIIALAGNPNSGKTTIFNALTGSNQRVGNWPGVTVEKKEGVLRLEGTDYTVVDLPGTYGLSARSIDERVARDFLVRNKPFLVAVILDASNLERNMYLALQIMELGVSKVVLVFNMMDVARSRGMEIDARAMSIFLGVPIVPTIGNKKEGIEDLKRVISLYVRGLSADNKMEPGSPFKYRQDIEDAIEQVESMIPNEIAREYPARWVAIRLMEDDSEYRDIVARMSSGEEILGKVEALRQHLERILGYDVETAMAEMRYGYIKGVVREFVKRRPSIGDRLSMSDRIDAVVTNRYLGLPIFLLIMWIAFMLTFNLGGFFSDYIDAFFTFVGSITAAHIRTEWLASFICDGVIGGVGAVLVFLPNIFMLFLMLSILEESGYMARGAFVMDKLMHAMGLHGKSFIPMVLGFGCNVPAIMATRTLENRKDRIITILVNPLMSCSARLPVYVLFAGALFSAHQGTVIFSIYILGIILAVVLARIFKSIFFKGETTPLVMELPPYHIPEPKGVILSAWQRSALFVRKAGTVIFAAVILIWLMASFPLGAGYASEHTLIGRLGSVLAPVFSPAGFGYWQAAVALFFGILAKEVVVGTLGTLYHTTGSGLSAVIASHFSPLSGYAFMVMTLVYIPCIATIAVIKRETNSWAWAGFAVAYSLILGWSLAVIIFQVGSLFA